MLLHRPDVLDLEIARHLGQVGHRHGLELRDVDRARGGEVVLRRTWRAGLAALALATITAVTALPLLTLRAPVPGLRTVLAPFSALRPILRRRTLLEILLWLARFFETRFETIRARLCG